MKNFKLKKEKFDAYRKTQIISVSWKNKRIKIFFRKMFDAYLKTYFF